MCRLRKRALFFYWAESKPKIQLMTLLTDSCRHFFLADLLDKNVCVFKTSCRFEFKK